MSFTRQLASVVAAVVFSSAQAGTVDVGNCPGPGPCRSCTRKG